MKRILSITGMLGIAFLFMSAITIMEAPQDPPKKKVKKHLKMVKVDEDGKKVELDTIIEGDKVFVWHGDSISGAKELKWISKDDFKLDSLHEHMDIDFDYEIDDDGKGNVFIMKSGKDGKTIVKEFHSKGDSGKNVFTFDILKDAEHGEHDVMMWHSDKGDNEMILAAPRIHTLPDVPKIMFRGKAKKGNVIDLSDPGVISFKKKKMSGGREKITIIRNEVKDEDVEVHEDIIIDKTGNHSMIWHGKEPKKAKAIKVIKSDDGKVEVIEDEKVFHIKEGDGRVKIIEEGGKVWNIDEMEEGTKVIEKDGKKITIKKTKEGKEVKVDVEVEEKKEENN